MRRSCLPCTRGRSVSPIFPRCRRRERWPSLIALIIVKSTRRHQISRFTNLFACEAGPWTDCLRKRSDGIRAKCPRGLSDARNEYIRRVTAGYLWSVIRLSPMQAGCRLREAKILPILPPGSPIQEGAILAGANAICVHSTSASDLSRRQPRY